MMTSPSLQYVSPSEGHTPIGSPAPSQILLHRVSSPNHLVSQHQYVDSPRSVPLDYSQQQYTAPSEQQFEYEHTPEIHPPEMYVNDDPHIYDFGPNGALPPDPQFAHPQMPQQQQQQQQHPQQEANHFMYAVLFPFPYMLINSPLLFKFNRPLQCTGNSETTCTNKLREIQ